VANAWNRAVFRSAAEMAALLQTAAAEADPASPDTNQIQEQGRMRKSILVAVSLVAAVAAAPAEGQLGGRLSAEPFVGYGFFGSLPGTNATLDGDLAYGARLGYQLSPQWGFFAAGQRSTPSVAGNLAGVQITGGEVTVDHWSAGVEFSYVPRGGAEGMLPILMEAGLGQARYGGGTSDLAVNIGLASALQLSPNLAIRYGVNDYISNYRNGNGITNQIFVRVGAELRF
jgi:hypothetical protein